MSPTTAVSGRAGIDIIAPSAAGDEQIDSPMATGDKTGPAPTMDDLMDRINGLGYSDKEIGILLETLGKAAEKAWAAVRRSPTGQPVGKIAKVQMNMEAHDVLDAIMKDKATAAPGSIHELADQVLLPEGYTFVHDRVVHCEVDVVRAG